MLSINRRAHCRCTDAYINLPDLFAKIKMRHILQLRHGDQKLRSKGFVFSSLVGVTPYSEVPVWNIRAVLLFMSR